ncbi:Uncharacterized conserved protein YeaO, DUF488 family [Gracilibacillus ureilyticus]|uniref:Uncharacterized conserved protein YeaO, DUF488 family n=1 Tax=Gracilibacillus ureilyticus TaxID=531814 RepID=A0A1H9PWZ9_9BACI|nr:DUF488 family protein [Gracilibacillus ureilyticus]SER52299.1 Uncharacterized conserved protein YeaO, DUF488 family [Gracilibacillus ureilyticus]
MQLKRIYEKRTEEDNVRILVDRLWPRGLSKEEVELDVWLKEIGPTNELRRWFRHDQEKFPQFRELYLQELKDDPQKKSAYDQLKKYYEENDGQITLVFSAKEQEYNHVQVLKEKLENTKKH